MLYTNGRAFELSCSDGYQFYLKSFYVNLYLNAGYSLTNNLFGSASYNEALGRPTDWLLSYRLKVGYKF